MFGLLEWFVVVSGLAGLFWAYYNYKKIMEVDLGAYSSDENMMEPLNSHKPSAVEIGAIIREGASEFIWSEYKICSVFILLMAAIVFFCVDRMQSWYTTAAFLIGAATSMFCGAFGMRIATFSNYRTTLCAVRSLGMAFKVAYRAGCVMGFTLVSVSMLVLLILITVYKSMLNMNDQSPDSTYYEVMFEAVAGYGLGGSTVAMFARVGGGIFTKAADLGSDLVGKVESNLPEDSPRNPATIADNVGDNVGDVAGMSADLFGSFAESTCAALVIACSSISNPLGVYNIYAVIFVLAIPAIGLWASIATSYVITEGEDVTNGHGVNSSLKNQLIISTLLLLIGLFVVCWIGIGNFQMIHHNSEITHHTFFNVFSCIAFGLVAGLIIGYVTEIMTSYSYKYVVELADSCRTGAATNIIYGLALGYLSTIIPVIVLCLVCFYSHSNLGYYGVALAALGMLSNLPICLAIDGYGPISDNAGGIAEMAELPHEVRERTDILDAAGNTTAAIGKGFAIGSATLVGFALYGAFLHSSYMMGSLTPGEMSFDDPMIFTSLLFGAMLPYAFSALTMKSVGMAALGMIDEVRRQIRVNPGILTGEVRPDYRACVSVSTKASLYEMILPGLLVHPLLFR